MAPLKPVSEDLVLHSTYSRLYEVWNNWNEQYYTFTVAPVCILVLPQVTTIPPQHASQALHGTCAVLDVRSVT